LPVAPPAPPQPIPQPVQSQYQPNNNQAQRDNYVDPYDKSNQFDDGSYDERWNNPGYQGDGRSGPVSRPAPAPQQNYNYQQAAPVSPSYQQQNYQQPQQQYKQPQQQQQQQQQYQQPKHYETTPNPHRFQPPGKLSLNRTPDGFSYSFNKS